MEASQPLPDPNPQQQSALARYWTAIAQGQFVIPECDVCHHRFLPPRMFCPSCGSESLSWFASEGLGRLYSFSVVEKAPSAKFAKSVPYVIALAALDDLPHGSRLYARLVDIDPAQVRVGQRVSVALRQLEDSHALPVLILAEAA